MSRMRVLLVFFWSSAALAAPLNLQPPATSMAAQEYQLHTLLLSITGLIFSRYWR